MMMNLRGLDQRGVVEAEAAPLNLQLEGIETNLLIPVIPVGLLLLSGLIAQYCLQKVLLLAGYVFVTVEVSVGCVFVQCC